MFSPHLSLSLINKPHDDTPIFEIDMPDAGNSPFSLPLDCEYIIKLARDIRSGQITPQQLGPEKIAFLQDTLNPVMQRYTNREQPLEIRIATALILYVFWHHPDETTVLHELAEYVERDCILASTFHHWFSGEPRFAQVAAAVPLTERAMVVQNLRTYAGQMSGLLEIEVAEEASVSLPELTTTTSGASASFALPSLFPETPTRFFQPEPVTTSHIPSATQRQQPEEQQAGEQEPVEQKQETEATGVVTNPPAVPCVPEIAVQLPEDSEDLDNSDDADEKLKSFDPSQLTPRTQIILVSAYLLKSKKSPAETYNDLHKDMPELQQKVMTVFMENVIVKSGTQEELLERAQVAFMLLIFYFYRRDEAVVAHLVENLKIKEAWSEKLKKLILDILTKEWVDFFNAFTSHSTESGMLPVEQWWTIVFTFYGILLAPRNPVFLVSITHSLLDNDFPLKPFKRFLQLEQVKLLADDVELLLGQDGAFLTENKKGEFVCDEERYLCAFAFLTWAKERELKDEFRWHLLDALRDGWLDVSKLDSALKEGFENYITHYLKPEEQKLLKGIDANKREEAGIRRSPSP